MRQDPWARMLLLLEKHADIPEAQAALDAFRDGEDDHGFEMMGRVFEQFRQLEDVALAYRTAG